jgi:hypothetical protein
MRCTAPPPIFGDSAPTSAGEEIPLSSAPAPAASRIGRVLRSSAGSTRVIAVPASVSRYYYFLLLLRTPPTVAAAMLDALGAGLAG